MMCRTDRTRIVVSGMTMYCLSVARFITSDVVDGNDEFISDLKERWMYSPIRERGQGGLISATVPVG